MSWTVFPPSEDDKKCHHCGESTDVRLIDNQGYTEDELICEDCFSDDEAYWDCLPRPIWPADEV